MIDVAYPAVFAALLCTADNAFESQLRITDGYDISEDPADVVMFGVPSLSDVSAIAAGKYTQEQMGHGASGIIREEGSVSGIALAQNGDASDAGAMAARTAAFDYIAALSAAIRADRSLGVTDFDLVVHTATAAGDVAEDKVDGATCAISFTVNYTALLGD